MTEGEAVPFIIGRPAKVPLVQVTIPVTAVIVTIMFLGGSRHHPAACSVLGELAMVLSEDELLANLDGALIAGAQAVREGLGDKRHRPDKSRFHHVIGNDAQLVGRIHPMELYAMGISAEAFLDDLDSEEEPTIYNSLETWARGASRFVTEREMLAIYEAEGMA